MLRAFDALAHFRHVAIAVSGGSDSIALMHLARSWLVTQVAQPASTQLSVLTVDHGLRAAAAEEARLVAETAGALGLPHHILRWDEAKPSSGLQAAAREARYQLLTQWCRDHGAGCLLVGHSCNDQAETVMMRLAHGSGVDGLAGMSAWRDLDGVMLYRPLLGTLRADLRAMLDRCGIRYVDDPSNEDVRYERVRVRTALASPVWSDLDVRQIARSAERLRDAAEALDRVTDHLIARHCRLHLGGFAVIEQAALRDSPREIRRRCLERAIRVIGGQPYPPRAEALGDLCDQLARLELLESTIAGCRIVTRKDKIVVAREFGRMDQGVVPVADGIVWDGRLVVQATDAAPELTIGAVGSEDWAALKGIAPAARRLPAFIGRTLPGLRRGAEIVAVPYLGHGHAEGIGFSFASRALGEALLVRTLQTEKL